MSAAQAHKKSMKAIVGITRLESLTNTNPNAVANRTRRLGRRPLTESERAWYSLLGSIDRSIVVSQSDNFPRHPRIAMPHVEEEDHHLMIGRNQRTLNKYVHSFRMASELIPPQGRHNNRMIIRAETSIVIITLPLSLDHTHLISFYYSRR